MPKVMIHILSEEAVLGEMDELPSSTDTMIRVKDPRRRDGKDIHYIAPDVRLVIWPLHKITYIEVMPSEEEDEIISFVRE